MRKRLPDDPRLLSLLENAVKGAQRGANLTRRLLAFARRQDLKREAVDVAKLIRGMTDLLERTLGPSIDILTRFSPSLRPIQADANQLEMALLNLAVNARDAMPDGGQLVLEANEQQVAAGNVHGLRPGNYVHLTVTDNGIGMEQATLSRALEPFFTTKGPGKGTGLGLSMVHGLTEQFGGRFALQSVKGKGTTAELWLPVAEARLRAVRADEAASTPAPQSRLVVLAVDDDSLVLTNTVAMLEDLGHTALSAASGVQALEMLRRDHEVDLVITDQAMPHLTGVQLAEAIGHEWPDIPVILATGYAELPPGAGNDLPKLAKPFTQSDLAGEIARAAERRLQLPRRPPRTIAP
jgi:CheY-like chemotaxis protein/two-component sensor histidine kinase